MFYGLFCMTQAVLPCVILRHLRHGCVTSRQPKKNGETARKNANGTLYKDGLKSAKGDSP
jgi:hypothetical protein